MSAAFRVQVHATVLDLWCDALICHRGWIQIMKGNAAVFVAGFVTLLQQC